MCSSKTCSTCKKTSWAGCGMHLPSVFASVPFENRCQCGYEAKEWTDEVVKAKSLADGPYPKAGGGKGGCTNA